MTKHLRFRLILILAKILVHDVGRPIGLRVVSVYFSEFDGNTRQIQLEVLDREKQPDSMFLSYQSYLWSSNFNFVNQFTAYL